MNIKIEINTDGEAFKENKCMEVANILSQLVSVYRQTTDIQPTEMVLTASNGNRCGTVTISEEPLKEVIQQMKDIQNHKKAESEE